MTIKIISYVIYPIFSIIWLYSTLVTFSSEFTPEDKYLIANIIVSSFFFGEILYTLSLTKESLSFRVIYIALLSLSLFGTIPEMSFVINVEHNLEAVLSGLLASLRGVFFTKTLK